ncbi:MAG: hypothetical protein ON057_000228 [Glomeribacter sp. 1016415]|nr:hypothetical protein [Glomeribacter sp. 1016415]
MTLIDPSNNSRSISTPNTHYHIVDNTTALNDSALSAINDQLSRKIEELENSHKHELYQLKNIIKDQNQKISGLEESIKELIDKLSLNFKSTLKTSIKDNILFNFTSESSNVVKRVEGFQGVSESFSMKSGQRIVHDVPIRGRYAQHNRDIVLVEFALPFPKNFSVHIQGHASFSGTGKPVDTYKVYIGSFGKEKLHEKGLELPLEEKEEWTSALFETEEENNNILSISIPKLSSYGNAGLKLYSINIIPR